MAEIGFTIIGNRGRALMNNANVHVKIRNKLFKEAFLTATYLDGLKVVEINGVKKRHGMNIGVASYRN